MNPIENIDSPEDFLTFNMLLTEAMGEIASARACIALEPEEEELLERMASGRCTTTERKTVVDMLVSNSEAMEYFAAALKGEDRGMRESLA